MLSSIAVELQSHILAHLPRRDLASVVRTSQHFHAVGVKLLYRDVELHSLDQVEAFFQITSLLPQGSAVASRHADAKEEQWKAIQTLEIDITEAKTRGAPLANLPRSFRGPGAAPFDLDRLVLLYRDDPTTLLPILQRFNPRELRLRRFNSLPGGSLEKRWLSATGWTNVADLTLVARVRGKIKIYETSAILAAVKSVTLVYHFWVTDADASFVLSADVLILTRMCPNLDGVRFRCFHCSGEQAIEKRIQRGLAGKPASFFSAVLAPAGSNVWGEKVER